MKDKEEFDDVPNDYFEDRISRLEKTVTVLSILVISIIVIGILLVIFK